MRTFLVLLLLIPIIAKCQFRNNFIGTYSGILDSYTGGHVSMSDRLYVDTSATDSNSIAIVDSIPGLLSFDYILYPDSTFAFVWSPTDQYGYFYSNGDSIFVHEATLQGAYYREWHCGRIGAGLNEISISLFSVYPNPASNSIFISSKLSWDNFKIKLFDSWGQTVLEKTFGSIGSKTEIDLAPLADGIYFIKIESKNNFFSQKVLIQK